MSRAAICGRHASIGLPQSSTDEGRRDETLRLGDQELEDREHHAQRRTSPSEGARAARDLRARRPRVHGDGWRADPLVLRRDLLVAICDTQEELDAIWKRLSEGGEEG